jgi:hypothetical protein
MQFLGADIFKRETELNNNPNRIYTFLGYFNDTVPAASTASVV